MKVEPTGNISVTVIVFAVSGPKFLAVKAYVCSDPAGTVVAEASLIRERSAVWVKTYGPHQKMTNHKI